jgi:hypothetical protein
LKKSFNQLKEDVLKLPLSNKLAELGKFHDVLKMGLQQEDASELSFSFEFNHRHNKSAFHVNSSISNEVNQNRLQVIG